MLWAYRIHGIFGEMVLPVLVLAALFWALLRAGASSVPARVLAVLVDLQVTLGLALWIYGLSRGYGAGGDYLRFSFLLHPILAIGAAVAAHLVARAAGGRRVLLLAGTLVLICAAILAVAASRGTL